ncbi:MAG: hypothetical protein JST68_15020 [Bacteroidetes bacterium]|nr:hypothetical protein [Bacteroidota bacterium]
MRRSIILISSLVLLLAPKQLVNACGFMVGPSEYRFWLLQPDLTNEEDLTPFFFASSYLYKGTDTSAKETYLSRNLEEWQEQIRLRKGKGVSWEDIDDLLNYTDPDLFFGHADSLAGKNSFVRYLLRKENSEWFRYMTLSKKVEQLAAHPDPWEEGPIPHANISRIIDEAKGVYMQASSGFIKMRTAYQLMRLYGFNGEGAAVSRVYDERIARVATSSWIKSAALYLKATKGEEPGSRRLLAEVFDRGDYYRSYCLEHFGGASIDSLLREARSGHERVVLRAMKAFNYPGRSLSAIQQIYAAEPGYNEIPFLLLREINKIEDWLVTEKVTSFKPAVYAATYQWQFSDEYLGYNKSNRLADQAYAASLGKFLLHAIADQKSTQPALLRLCSAHLSMLLGDYAAAEEQLRVAASYKDVPKNVRSQIAINQFLLGLEKQGLDAAMEKAFLGLLRRPAKRLGIYDAEIMKDQLILYTARKMMQKGDKARGLMLLSRTRRALGDLPIGAYKDVYEEIAENAGPEDYDSIVAIVDRKHKSPFEQFVTKGRFKSSIEYYDWADSSDLPMLFWDRNRLMDGKASWYIRNNELEAALKAMRSVPDSFWQREPYTDFIGGNPFYLNIYKNGYYSGKRTRGYNKRGIVEKMLALQSLASGAPAKRAESHFQLANAWYNMSYYGNNWLVVKPWWSSSELDEYGPKVGRSGFNDVYYGCSRAKALYLQAMRETRDKKLATLCCFMAGVCEENRKRHVGGKNPYLAELKEKGVSEGYYREMVKECAVYNDYVRTFDREL